MAFKGVDKSIFTLISWASFWGNYFYGKEKVIKSLMGPLIYSQNQLSLPIVNFQFTVKPTPIYRFVPDKLYAK